MQRTGSAKEIGHQMAGDPTVVLPVRSGYTLDQLNVLLKLLMAQIFAKSIQAVDPAMLVTGQAT